MSDRAFEIAGASYLSVESDCMIEQMIMLHGLTKWKLPSDPFLLLTFRVRARIVDMIDRRPYCSSYRGGTRAGWCSTLQPQEKGSAVFQTLIVCRHETGTTPL